MAPVNYGCLVVDLLRLSRDILETTNDGVWYVDAARFSVAGTATNNCNADVTVRFAALFFDELGQQRATSDMPVVLIPTGKWNPILMKSDYILVEIERISPIVQARLKFYEP
jgi:hypothetical protein